MEVLGLILVSFFAMAVFFSIFWLIYQQKGNAGVVDIAWSLGFSVLAILYFFLGTGNLVRKWILLFLVLIWSLRLSWSLIKRFSFDQEDPRYTNMIQGWKGNILQKVYALFLFQSFLLVIVSLPFVLSVQNPFSISWIEILAIVIWIVGFLGESISDYQLESFKSKTKDKVCEEGFWYYSRHPNYFFEWVVWISYALFASTAPYGLFGWISPIIMGTFLVWISGIPYSEKHALKSKGKSYEHYKKTTSIFFPWFKKKKS